MPRNGSGIYTLPQAAFAPGTPISSAAVNSDFSDVATALTNSLARNGEGGMTAALPLANNGLFYSNDADSGLRRTAANTQALSVGGQDWTFTETALTAPDGAEVSPMIGEIRMWALLTPPAGWILLQGQACTTSYPLWRAALIASSSPYGTSGGDPLFPNLQCVVPAGLDVSSRGLLAGSNILGALLGTQSATLGTSNLPPYTPSGAVGVSLSDPGHVHQRGYLSSAGIASGFGGFSLADSNPHDTGSATTGISVSGTSFTGTAQGGTSTPFSVVQATLIINFIGRAA